MLFVVTQNRSFNAERSCDQNRTSLLLALGILDRRDVSGAFLLLGVEQFFAAHDSPLRKADTMLANQELAGFQNYQLVQGHGPFIGNVILKKVVNRQRELALRVFEETDGIPERCAGYRMLILVAVSLLVYTGNRFASY